MAARDTSPRVVGALLALTCVVGLVVSLASWGFLEGIHQIQVGVYDKLPGELGFDSTPVWWPLPILGIAGLIVAFAIARLPGAGGHNPAEGLSAGATTPPQLPGVILAALGTIPLGLVLGPEAPLIALGSGLGILAIKLARRDAPAEAVQLIGAAGSFSAVSFIFGQPLLGAVLLIEAAALDRRGLQVVVPVGLLASGIGSLVSIGIDSWTGLSSKDFAISALSLPHFDRPNVVDFLWTLPFAAAIAIGCVLIFRGALALQPRVTPRPFLWLPLIALVIGGIAIGYSEAADQDVGYVLFSGQDALPGLVQNAGTFSVISLLALIAAKGVAWSMSLASYRGGPTFPGLFLGVAAGVAASHLPGFDMTPAVAVGIGAAMAAVLKLPLSAVVLSVLLTAGSGAGAEPLAIVGVVVAYVLRLAMDARAARTGDDPGSARSSRRQDASPRPTTQVR
jgi:hypothetical protein